MGMNVFIDGELVIQSDKVLEAGKLLLQAIAGKDELDPEYLPSCYAQKIKTPKGIVGILEKKMEAFQVHLEPDGRLTFGLEDSTRREEQDQWIFEALAPAFDDGSFHMSADDSLWLWDIKDGEFSVICGEIVYDHDDKAVPTITKILGLIYRDGKPLSSILNWGSPEFEEVMNKIETLLRETGYGPQAGMSELERLSEV
jgi:hypothetical protein